MAPGSTRWRLFLFCRSRLLHFSPLLLLLLLHAKDGGPLPPFLSTTTPNINPPSASPRTSCYFDVCVGSCEATLRLRSTVRVKSLKNNRISSRYFFLSLSLSAERHPLSDCRSSGGTAEHASRACSKGGLQAGRVQITTAPQASG